MFLHFSDLPDSSSKLVSLSFKNFKPFKSWQTFKPAQINLLIGPNNSGKSSLIEFLRILSQDFPDSLDPHELPLREKRMEKLQVVSSQPIEIKAIIETVANSNEKLKRFVVDSSGKTCFEIYVKYQQALARGYSPIYFEVKDINSKRTLVKAESGKDGNKLDLDWTYFYSKYINQGNKAQEENNFLSDVSIVNTSDSDYNMRQSKSLLNDLSRLTWSTMPNWEGGFDYEVDLKWLIKADVAFVKNLKEAAYDTVEQKSYRYGEHPMNLVFPSVLDLEDIAKKNDLRNDRDERIDYNYKALGKYMEAYFGFVNGILDIFRYTIPKVKYLPVERLGQKKIYFSEEFKDYNSWMERDLEGYGKKVITTWLKKFGIASGISKVEYTDDVFGILVKRHGKEIPLYMLGYGALQIVLLLLSSYNGAKRNDGGLGANPYNWPGSPTSILALEEPEANLHPKLQSQLADLFAEVIKVNRESFIIETHSEYLVRKLQYLVAKGKLKSEDLSITYFEEIKHNAKSGKMRTIRVRKDGMLLDDFGAGFFDEAARWTFELFRAAQDN